MWVLYLSLYNVVLCSLFLRANCVSTTNHQLVMASRRAKRGKSKATSKLEVVFDRLRFHTYANKQTFETLNNYRSIWGERQISLDELHPSVCGNLQSMHWLSLCTNIHPPPVDLIRELYSNL